VSCEIEVPASGRSLIQSSPSDYGVSERDGEASIIRRTWPTNGCCAMGKGAKRVMYDIIFVLRLALVQVYFTALHRVAAMIFVVVAAVKRSALHLAM
jgi:hypothetical protein